MSDDSDDTQASGFITPEDLATPILPATAGPNPLFGVGTLGYCAPAASSVTLPAFAQPPSSTTQPLPPTAVQATADSSTDMSDTDDDPEVCSLTFSRADDVDEYLIDVRGAAEAAMSGSTAPSDQKLIARALQGCTSRERKLVSGGR